MQCFSDYIFPFFLLLVIIGAFFLVNLTLAVIKVHYSEATESLRLALNKKK